MSAGTVVHGKPEITKARNEALGELSLVAAVEMIGAEVAVVRAVLEHVISGGPHRSRDSDGGFLRTATALDTEELRAEIGVLFASRGPGRLDEGGFEPRIARSRPRGQSFAGALVQPGTEPCPRHEVGGAREARHVEADLGHDHARD